MSEFKFTDRQLEARRAIGQACQFFMLFGGSRSGKTFLAVYVLIVRALKSSGSRHLMARFRFNAIKASIIMDTFPKVMKICFPGVQYHINKTDWFVTFKNGSEIWFGGLDDKERTEKILGQEYATIYLNECSQIPWASVGIVITRLAQNCSFEYKEAGSDQVLQQTLPLRMLFDCNPPDKNHWTYRLFVQKVDPDTKKPLTHKGLYGSIQMNPGDNLDNLPATYIQTLENLPPHLRRRFLEGEFKDANPNGLFPQHIIDQWRVEDPCELPDMVRMVVGVDPSGAGDADNEDNDPIGIYAAGLGVDGNAYLIEDCTVLAGPAVWGKMSTSAYHRHGADVMAVEKNFGGEMAKFTIQTADRNVNIKMVNASRGKVVRAEPFSPLFHDGKIRIVGRQPDFEEELGGFSTHGFTGEKSPNRADAAFWALTELFPGVVGKKKKQNADHIVVMPTVNHW